MAAASSPTSSPYDRQVEFIACYSSRNAPESPGASVTKLYIQLQSANAFTWHFPYDEVRLKKACVKIRQSLANCLGLLAKFRVELYQEKFATDPLLLAVQELQTLRIITLPSLLPTCSRPFKAATVLPQPEQTYISTPMWYGNSVPPPPPSQSLCEAFSVLETYMQTMHNEVVARHQLEGSPNLGDCLQQFRVHLRQKVLPCCDAIWFLTVKIDEMCRCEWSPHGLLLGLTSTYATLRASRVYSELVKQAVAVNLYFPDTALAAANMTD